MAKNDSTEDQGRHADGTGQQDELTPEGEAMQAAVDEINAKGFLGDAADPTPDEHYTVQGVVDGKPTPENDPDQAAKAGSRKFIG